MGEVGVITKSLIITSKSESLVTSAMQLGEDVQNFLLLNFMLMVTRLVIIQLLLIVLKERIHVIHSYNYN